jgi:hypothetical protein
VKKIKSCFGDYLHCAKVSIGMIIFFDLTKITIGSLIFSKKGLYFFGKIKTRITFATASKGK